MSSQPKKPRQQVDRRAKFGFGKFAQQRPANLNQVRPQIRLQQRRGVR